MADYRKLAIQLIAADGKIDENEIKLLRKALFADGKITHEEVTFVGELRSALIRKAKEVSPEFEKFYLHLLHTSFLDNGIISGEEVGMIKKLVIGDKLIPAGTKKSFLDGLKKKATTLAPEFEKLYKAIK